MMKCKISLLAFLLLASLVIGRPAAADDPQPNEAISNLMSVLKDERQKAVYNVNLNTPFSKEKSGINESINTETGELSILQTLVDLPGRNGQNVVLRAEYRSRDARLFEEATRGGSAVNNCGVSVVAFYDVFDQDGYWVKTGGVQYATGQTIAAEFAYGQQSWVFTGLLEVNSGAELAFSEGICNTIQEQSRALSARYLIGAGWAFDLPYLEVDTSRVDESAVYVHLHDGSTYKADFTTSNGLEKYELRDLLFDKYTGFQFNGQVSAYRLLFRDGDEFFFSSEGFLIGQRNRFRNTIRYYYEEISGIKRGCLDTCKVVISLLHCIDNNREERNEMTEEKKTENVFFRIHENYKYMNQMMVEEMDIASQHDGITGNYREEMWVKFFRNIIPQKFSLAQGVMIIDSNGNVSKEVDIAVFDEQYTPYVFQYNTLKLIPIEAVVIAIECKSTSLKDEELRKWAKKIDNLSTRRSGISRIAQGYAIGVTNRTQVRTRPIKILASIKDDKNNSTIEERTERLGDYFDFIIQEQL